MLWVWLFFLLTGPAMGVTPAGSIIQNQASASYLDTQGVRRVATSNVVETLIRQVAAVELTLSQSKPGAVGQELFFTHTLVNTGNGVDQYDLRFNPAGGDFTLAGLQLYPDADRDGQPDSYVAINISPELQAGESWSFIAAGQIPFNAQDQQSASITVVAESNFDISISAANTDTVTITEAAVIEITKSVDTLSGNSPDGPFTVRIQYNNTTDVPATDVALIDALPSGMQYIPGSGVWSTTGNTPLTDNDPQDLQSGIRYCAYDASCSGLIEADSDSDNDSVNQVTAVIETLGARESGFIEFQIAIATGLSAGSLFNTSELEYGSAGQQSARILSNTVPFTVTANAGVVINGSRSSSIDGTGEPLVKTDSVFGASSNLPVCQTADSDPDGDGIGFENNAQCIVEDPQAGNSLFYTNVVWNTGSDAAAFDITLNNSSFPPDTIFRLLRADAQTPLLDTNGNGIPDTGLIPPGSPLELVVQVLLPTTNSGNNGPYLVTTVATSVNNPDISNTMLNQLNSITAASVDLTNGASLNEQAMGEPAVAGAGAGPEPNAVTTLSVAPGGSVDFSLVVNNTSAFAVEFTLEASIHSDFSSVEVPDQWAIQFLLDNGSVVSSTGVIAAGEFINVTARVSVPAQAIASLTSVYFRVRNENHAVEDIKHDAVQISEQQSLLLGINQEAQVEPGGSHLYHHTLANTGNTDIDNIALSVSDSLAAEGWSSLIYEDSDGDSLFSSADLPVDTTSLAAGESTVLFVRVFAPATAGDGIANSTELSAGTATETLLVTDISNVSSGRITVLKEQALDNQCDGILDSNYTSSGFSVEPGNNCVRYRLTAHNAGSAGVLNVVVADATPAFTSYTGSALCSKGSCTLTEPLNGGEGEIVAALPQLAAGDSVVVEFMVRID